MEWLSQNWVWVLFFVAFVAMHMFGHGGHGGHGGGSGDDDAAPKPAGKDSAQRRAEPAPEHRH